MHDSEPGDQYRLRLCRAVALLTFGATLHLALPREGVRSNPAILPVQVVHADLRLPAPVALSIERTLVAARLSAELEPGLPEGGRDPQAVGTTGHPEDVSPVSLPGLRAAVDLPGPALIVTPAAAVTAFNDEASLEPSDGLKEDGDPAVPAAPEPLDRLTPSWTSPVAASRSLSLNQEQEEELVRRLLAEYTGAFERLDVGATKAMWPSVDGKALERAYGRLSAQRLTLESCGIRISGSTANARCRGSATYQPRIGRRAVEIASREWTFDLSKKDTAWRIVNTFVR